MPQFFTYNRQWTVSQKSYVWRKFVFDKFRLITLKDSGIEKKNPREQKTKQNKTNEKKQLQKKTIEKQVMQDGKI